MSEPTTEYERVLTAFFGDDWEMFLAARGIVGGDRDETVDEDVVSVAAAMAAELRGADPLAWLAAPRTDERQPRTSPVGPWATP